MNATAKKIIRTVTLFTSDPSTSQIQKLNAISEKLVKAGFEVQTLRMVSSDRSIAWLDKEFRDTGVYMATGSLCREEAMLEMEAFLQSGELYFNLEIEDQVTQEDVGLLFHMIKHQAHKTFHFCYSFSNALSSPYFPSAQYQQDGYSIGLQSTDLSEGCTSLSAWLLRMKEVWNEIGALFIDDKDFLGIDSSIAPMESGSSSLVNIARRLYGSFSQSVTTDLYVKISGFIKAENPMPVGLNGLMFPCLEDFELAEEYEKGEFNIERNLFLSLHSGCGIDTYPIGVDEDPERVRQILNLLLGLSKKYNKPLSARFISDGKTRIGEMSDFRNQYLKDVVIRKL